MPRVAPGEKPPRGRGRIVINQSLLMDDSSREIAIEEAERNERLAQIALDAADRRAFGIIARTIRAGLEARAA